MKTFTKLLTVKIIFVLFILTAGSITLSQEPYPAVEVMPMIELPTMEDSVAYEIAKLDFKYPHIVLAQAKLESGNFTSTLFQNNNNMFGMKMPSRRPTTAIGKKASYANYSTWMCSIQDQKIYYSKYLDHRTEEEVFAYLSKYYAEDSRYVQKLQKIIQKEKLKEKFHNDDIV